MSKLLLSTDTLKGYGLNRIFAFAKQAGFDGVDLLIDPKDFDTQNPEYIQGLVTEYGMPVVTIQAPMTSTKKDVIFAIEMAKELNVKVIVVQPPKLLNFSFIKWLTTEIPKIRQKEGLSIALENAPSDMFLGIIPEHAMSNLGELKKFKHAALDTTRVAQKHDDLIRVYNVLRKYLVHVHISNVKRARGYQMPEEGVLPLESFLTKLKQEGFKGAVSFKIHPKFIKAGDDAKTLKNLITCKKFYENFFLKV